MKVEYDFKVQCVKAGLRNSLVPSITSPKPNLKSIGTLDLQFYDKCMRMTDNTVIRDNFIFRLGELHTLFAMLKVLRRNIIDSGLDNIFIETRIYGPTTFGQIIEGKHMKRYLEAYFTLYLA